MTNVGLEEFLRLSVPLSAAMEMCVQSLTKDALILQAPFEPNRNQHGTVFGGSSSTLCTLAAWGLLYSRLEGTGLKTKLVVKSSEVRYLAPISCDLGGEFEARAGFINSGDWDAFLQTLQREGKATITLSAQAYSAENPQVVGTSLKGEFSALLLR